MGLVYCYIATPILFAAVFGEWSSSAQQLLVTPPIQAQIGTQYPGWRISRLGPEAAASARAADPNGQPNVVRGDFDGNGRLDVAVLIEYPRSDRQTASGVQVVAFLADGTRHKLFALERPHAHFPNQYIRLIRRGSRGYDLTSNAEFQYERDAIGVEFDGERGHAWIYRDGKFVSIWTSD